MRLRASYPYRHYISYIWTDFCASTGIRGFSYVSKALCGPERAFWVASIIICGILTTIDIVSLIKKFASEPMLTQVLVNSNQTIHLGTPTICIDLHISGMNFGGLDLENVSTVKAYLEQFEDNKNVTDRLVNILEVIAARRLPDMEMIKRIPQLHKRKPLGEENATENQRLRPLMALITCVISAIYRVENLVRGEFKMTDINWGVRKPSTRQGWEKYYIEQKTSESIAEVHRFLMSKNESLVNLVGIIGALLCEQMFLNVVATGRNESNGQLLAEAFSPCQKKLITWLGTAPFGELGKEVLCIKLDLEEDALFFGDPEQNTYIYLNTTNVFAASNEVDPEVTIDLSGEPVSTTSSQGLLYVDQKHQVVINVNILGEYNEKSTWNDPCIEESFLMCRLKCRSRYILNYCKCRPIGYENIKKKKSPIEICGENNKFITSDTQQINQTFMGFTGNFSTDCWLMKTVYDPDPMCKAKCIRECQYRIWGRETTHAQLMADTNVTILKISVDPFVYPVMTEIELMDWKGFMSSLGGNLSFWLGASFMVLLHALIFIIRIPFQIQYFAKNLTPNRRKDLANQSTV